MENRVTSFSKISSFKIVLIYAVVSAVYIYTSDFLLEILISNIDVLSKIQTCKGFSFILITAALLYVLVKRNMENLSAYYQNIIDVKQQSDEQLKSSQEEYMSLFNHSPLPMWIFDIDTLQFLKVNEAACRTYGYSPEEYNMMTIKDIRPPEDISLMEQALTNSLKSDHYIVPDILRHRKKNGEIIQVKIENTFVTFEGKKVRLSSATDVTKEINIQNELIETYSRLRVASEIAGLGYWTNDLVSGKIDWSDELYNIFEVDPLKFELNLENIKTYFCPNTHQEFSLDLLAIFQDNKIRESEHQIITGTNKTKWILERQYLTTDGNGNPAKLEGIAMDITERKIHEQEIEQSNDRFKLLAKATVEAIIDWDIMNDKTIWGEGFHTLFGYDLSIYDNYLWSRNIHPDDRETVLFDLAKTLQDPAQEHFTAEFRFLKANGDVAYVQHKGLFIRDESGKPTRALGAMIDITESLDKMRKIELQNKTLKNIAWTQSHIVRAPLANLKGLIEILKNNLNSGVSQAVLLGYMSESVEKLDTVIHDIVRNTKEVDEV